MKRVPINSDIHFKVNDIRGIGEHFTITFYTTNEAVNITKTDANVIDGKIVLNGSELMTLGAGVLNYTLENIEQNANFNDGYFNSSSTGTTDYYLQGGVIIPDGDEQQTVMDMVANLAQSLANEVQRSTTQDNAHDAAMANVYTKAEIDDMLDDIDVELPDNIVTDDNYTHTDNNYTTTEKNKLAGIANGAEVNVQSDWAVTNSSSDAFIKNKPTNVSAFTNDVGYLTSYTETDPTVPSWAKRPTKPTYTASEVGALSLSTVIPSKTSDLTNDSNYVSDSNYVHTDNNYTSEDKQKLSNMDGKQVTVITVTNPSIETARTFKDKDGNILSDSALLAILKDETKEVVMEYKNGDIFKYMNLSYYEETDGEVYFTFTLVDTNYLQNYSLASETLELYFENNALGECGLTTKSYPTAKDNNLQFGQGYGSSSSSSGTYTVTLGAAYEQIEGSILVIYFSHDVPQGTSLNINRKGAHPIYYRNAAIGADVIKAGDTVTFMYHSNRYYLISNDRWGLNA